MHVIGQRSALLDVVVVLVACLSSPTVMQLAGSE